MRDASGDSNFTLPYWDWSTSRSLPSAFRNPASSLFEPGRSINGGQLLPTDVVVDDFSESISNTGFSGFSFGLEGSPHGAVHVLIGGRMASVPTAANDPIFWLHHCNIDRAWDSWLALGGGRTNPTDPAFLNRTFTLIGQAAAPETLRAGDMLDSAALGYRYSGLSGLSPLSSPIPVDSGFQGVASSMVAVNHGQVGDDHGHDAVRPSDKKSITVASSSNVSPAAIQVASDSPPKPLGLTVERIELQSRNEGEAAMRAAVATAAPATQQRILVEVVGLACEETPRFAFTVYLNLPADTAPEKLSDEIRRLYRVGTLNFFGLAKAKSDEHAHAADTTEASVQRFDATATVAWLREAGLWKEDKYSVTLVPLTPVATQGEDPELQKLLRESAEASKITYERVDLNISSK